MSGGQDDSTGLPLPPEALSDAPTRPGVGAGSAPPTPVLAVPDEGAGEPEKIVPAAFLDVPPGTPRPCPVDYTVEPIIRFRGVGKSFGPKQIYEGLDLDIYPGETLTIIGGSGVGKSVMLKLLIGLLETDSGSITAFGEEVTTMSERQLLGVRKRVAMLFQGGALFDSLTTEENIDYPMLEHGWGTAAERDARVDEVLHMVGLPDPAVRKRKPSELSGGMRKRVALARAIAMEPDVILYDEPTTGLDPVNVRRINGLILSLQQKLGVTSVVVTHDMDTVFTVTNRLAMVYDRHIAFTGSPAEARVHENRHIREFVQGGLGVLDEDV